MINLKTIFDSGGCRYALAVAVILTLFVTGCEQRAEPVKPYLILYAFDTEGELLTEKMTIEKSEKILGRTVHIGELSGENIVLAESGVGMTNAAMTTQKLIDRYNPKGIIFSGIAGAIDTGVNIGDIVICEKWATHDYGYYGAEGFSPGGIRVVPAGADSSIRMMYYEVDSALYSKAIGLPDSNVMLDSIGDRVPKLVVGGVGVSGNSFIDQVEKRLWLSEEFGALTTDMESAAVAQVCAVNGIPFIIFRSASDLAGGSGSESAKEEIEQFFEVAAVNSGKIVVKLLESL